MPVSPKPGPSPSRARTASGANPTPLSAMVRRTLAPSCFSATCTVDACACFMTLLSASWTMRYRFISVSRDSRAVVAIQVARHADRRGLGDAADHVLERPGEAEPLEM